jgi:hypothetical protein
LEIVKGDAKTCMEQRQHVKSSQDSHHMRRT